MNRTYWEDMAPGYNEEIFDVLKNDSKGIIRRTIKSMATPSKSVIDVGCAIGKWLPVLSPAFKQVHAIDISAKNLSIAKKTYPQLQNVSYERVDMSAARRTLPKFDVAICINAILTDSLRKRENFFSNLSGIVKPGGKLLLVVPSLESWLLTRIIQSNYKIDQKLFKDHFNDKEGSKRYRQLRSGNVEIDDVATKHYLGDELQLLLSRYGFTPEKPKKIAYSWTTEFINPPSWLDEPRPWDWMITAVKND